MSAPVEREGMVTRKLLREITERIVDAVNPEKIILFGSYAYGKPTLDSDIDLLVIMRSRQRPIERARAISDLFLHRRFGMDILVRTPGELKERLRIGDYFFREITQRGKVLYERRVNARVGRQSGNGFQRRARSCAKAQGPTARQGDVRLRSVRGKVF
jgi:predicted nucleotidyltransferase